MKTPILKNSVVYLVLSTFLLSSCGTPFEEAIPKPVTNPDTITIIEDASKTDLDLLGNDIDITDAELKIETHPTASEGTLEINAEKTIVSFTPALNHNQQVQFQYSATTGGGTSEPTTVTINITPVNDPHTGTISINGTPVDSVAISALNGVSDPDGINTPTYQWLLDDADIVGATSMAYTPLVGDITKTLKIKLSYYSGADTSPTVVESVGKVVGANPAGNVAPEITNQIPSQIPALDESIAVLLTNHFADTNGDTLNFSFDGTPPTWITLVGNNIIINPTTGQQTVGEQATVTVKAHDWLLFSPGITFTVEVVDSTQGAGESGTVVTSFTDAPSDDYQQIWIDVDRVSADYSLASDKGETDITQKDIGSIDLLDLRGVAQMFNSMQLKEGYYSNLTVHLKPTTETGKAQIKLLGNDETVSFKSLSSNKILLGGNFEVVKNQRTDIVLDFEVNKWDFLSSTDTEVDPKKLKPAKKDKEFIKDHVKRISLTGELEDTLGDNSYTFVVNKKRHKVLLPSGFVGKLGVSYELEGTYSSESGLITVEEITEKLDTKEYTRQKIKLSGMVVSVESEEDSGVTKFLSMNVKPNRSSAPIKAALARVNLEGKIKFKYGKITDLKEEVRVIVYGEISSDGDISPLSIIIKGAPKDTDAESKYFNKERLVYLDNGKVKVSPTLTEQYTFSDLDLRRVNKNIRVCLDSNEKVPVRVIGKETAGKVEVKKIYTKQQCKKPTLENPTEIKFMTGKVKAQSCVASEGTEISNHYNLQGSYKVIGGVFNRSSGGQDQILKGYVFFGNNGKLRSNYRSFFGTGSIKHPSFIINKDKLQVINIAGSATGKTLTIKPKSGYIELDEGNSSIYVQKHTQQKVRMINCDITLDSGVILKTDTKTRWYGNYGTMEAGDKAFATVKDGKTISLKIKQAVEKEEKEKTLADKKKEAGGPEQLRKDIEAKMALEMKKKLEALEKAKETLEKKLEELKKKLKDLEDKQKEKLKSNLVTESQIKDFLMKEGSGIIKDIQGAKEISSKELDKLKEKLSKFIKNRKVGELSQVTKELLESLAGETSTTKLKDYLKEKVRDKDITKSEIKVKPDTYIVNYNKYGILESKSTWLRINILENDVIPEPISSPRKTSHFKKGDYRVLNSKVSVTLSKPKHGHVQSSVFKIHEKGLPSSGKWVNERYNLTSFNYIRPRNIPTDKDGNKVKKEVFEYKINDRTSNSEFVGEITIVFQAPEEDKRAKDSDINTILITSQYGKNLIDNIKRDTTWVSYQLSKHDPRFLQLAKDVLKFTDKKELSLSKTTAKFVSDLKTSIVGTSKGYETVLVNYLKTLTGLVDTKPFISDKYKYKTYMAVKGKSLYIKTKDMFLEADKEDKVSLYIEARNQHYTRSDLEKQYPNTDREFNTRSIGIAKEARLIQNNSMILFKPNKLGEFWVMLKAKGSYETMPIRIVVGEKKVEDTKNEDQKEFDKFLVSDSLFRDIKGVFENAKIKPIFVKDIYAKANPAKPNQSHRMIKDMSIRIYKFIKLQEDKRGGYIVNSIDSAPESQSPQDVYNAATRKIYTHIKSTMPSMKNLSVVDVFEYLAKKYGWKYEKPKNGGSSIQEEYNNYLKNDRYIKELGLMIKSYGFLKNEIYAGNPGKADTRGKQRVVKIALSTIQIFRNRDVSGLNSIDVGFVNDLIRSEREGKLLDTVKIFEYLAKKLGWKYENPIKISKQKQFDNYLNEVKEVGDIKGLFSGSSNSQVLFVKDVYSSVSDRNNTAHKKIIRIGNALSAYIKDDRKYEGYNSETKIIFDNISKQKISKRTAAMVRNDYIKLFEYLANKYQWKYEKPNNLPYQTDPIENLTVERKVQFNKDLRAYFIDKDADKLTFELKLIMGAPNQLIKLSSDGKLSVFSSNPYTGTYKVEVSDGKSKILSNPFSIKIDNKAPIATKAKPSVIKVDLKINEAGTIDFSKYFVDPDGDKLSYELVILYVSDEERTYKSRGRTKRTFNWYVRETNDTGIFKYQDKAKIKTLVEAYVEVKDVHGKAHRENITILPQKQPNRAPIATKAKPMEIVMEIVGNTPGILDVSTYFEDPDGDKLKYQLTFSYYSDTQAQITKGMASNDGIFKYNNLPTLSKTLFGKIRVIDEHGATLEHSVRLKAGIPMGPSPITREELITKITNGEDVTKVNTSEITDMNALFKGNKTFNQDISGWDTSKVTNMNELFRDASLFNQDISGWDTSKVTQMQTTFLRAHAFNQKIGSWDVSNVTDMYAMFYNASSFNQPLNDWNVGNVTRMEYMLAYMTKFNQPLGKWDVSKVTNFNYLMQSTPFNQDISKWAVRADATKAIWRARTAFSDTCTQLPPLWRDPSCATKPATTDPLYESNAWHINPQTTLFAKTSIGNQSIDLIQLKDKYLGTGVTIGIVDQGVSINHPDLKANMVVNGSHNFKDGTSNTTSTNSAMTHGTRVAGTAAAVGWNDIGSRGVAPKAKIKSFNLLEKWSDSNFAGALGGLDTSKDVSVFNQSFGSTSKIPYVISTQLNTVEHGFKNGRNGKGTVYVKSSGNSFEVPPEYGYKKLPCPKADWKKGLTCGSTAMAGMKNVKEQILVGATHGNHKASFSTPGSAIWVSAPGTNIPTPSGKDQYLLKDAGTSFSAPMVAGVVALILEANPELSSQDVKHILAKTSSQIDKDFKPVTIKINAQDHIATDAWTKNSAGNLFHNYYGFGRVHAKNAVDMAKAITTDSQGYQLNEKRYENKVTINPEKMGDIPDNNINGIVIESEYFNFQGGISKIEHTSVSLDLTHDNLGDISVEVTSPSGTKSILIPFNNNTEGYKNRIYPTYRLGTNAFYEENPEGKWKLRVIDGNNGGTGKIASAGFTFNGR